MKIFYEYKKQSSAKKYETNKERVSHVAHINDVIVILFHDGKREKFSN